MIKTTVDVLSAIDACKDKKFAIAVNTASIRDRDTYCCEVGMCSKGKKVNA